MNKKIISLVTVITLFFTSVGFADTSPDKFQVPTQTILGTEAPVPLGELVDLSLSPITNPSSALIGKDYKWSVVETGTDKAGQIKLTGKRVRENNDGVFFGAGIKNKTLYVNCICVYLFALKDKDGKITEIATRTVVLCKEIKIGENEPDPVIPPNPPPPGPAPVFLPGVYSLAKTSYDLANSKVSVAASRTKGAPLYAKAYRGLASEINATSMTMETALKKASQYGHDAVGTDFSNWSAFGDSLQEVLYPLYQNKKMNTPKDFAVALGEIADGLEKVK